MLKRARFAAIALALMAGVPVRAQTPAPAAPPAATGALTGRVTQPRGEPIAGADVNLLGTARGTTTDADGLYRLLGVPVGVAQVKVRAVGHLAQVRAATIDAGTVTRLDFELAINVIEVPEIEVLGRKMIDLKTSEVKKSIHGDDLRDLPVDDITRAAALKAGLVAIGREIHARGGRAGEFKMRVNEIEVEDPLLGGAVGIANLAIADADIHLGGFDAEIGNALSGVLSVTTREGGPRFGGQVRWDTDRYGDPTKTFDNFDRFTFGLGGPTPIKDLTYFATYEGTFQDTYLRSAATRSRRTLWDFIRLGNRQSNRIATSLKLAYRLSPRHKVTLETLQNREFVTPYDHMWSRSGFVQVRQDTVRAIGRPDQMRPRYGAWSPTRLDSTYVAVNMADHFPSTDDRFDGVTAVWTDQISPTSVWTTRLSTQRFRTLTSVGQKQPWDYWVESPQYWDGNTQLGSENNLYFATHGDYPVYSNRDNGSWVLKSDLSSASWKQHGFKTGLESRYNRVRNLTLGQPNGQSNGLPGATRSDFVNYNPEVAFYVQDRWEYEGMVLNVGARYDMFTPGDQVPTADLASRKRYKQQVSPRLGVAYPISERDVLSFHYGWTYQTPGRNYVFENRGVSAAVAVRGNPDLEPETNVAYQAAVQHLFTSDLSGQFSVFFRDIYGLLTARAARDEFGNQISVWENADYASARGLEATLTKAFSHRFSAEVNYSYQIATGVASNPGDAQQFLNGGVLYLPISERPLNWDQRNTFTLQGVVREPGRWGFHVVWQYASGRPFTPLFRNNRRTDPTLTNSRRLPSSSTLTIQGDKYYKVWGQNLTLFVDARNLLDAKNVLAISQDTSINPFLNQSGDEYAIYYSETGRAGGAYLQDVNGDNVLDWVPVRDPRVFEEGRAVRMGASVTF